MIRVLPALAVGLVGVLAACSVASGESTLPTSGTPTLSTRQVETEPAAASSHVLAAALPGTAEPTCVNASLGWVGRELSRTGDVKLPGPQQLLPRPKQDPTGSPLVQGYLDRTYAVCGQRLGVHLAAITPTRVVVEAIRVGSYRGGFTGRLVWHSAPVLVRPHTTLPREAHVTEDNAWPTTTTVTPQASWPPGMYVIRFRTLDRAAPDSYQPLYLLTSGAHASFLAVGADLTELAYNRAGGSSLYFGPGATLAAQRATRAYIASTHRALLGGGLTQMFSMDVPLAIVLARHHITADWTSDTSLDADPGQVRGYATILIPGHSEYWTRRNYDTLQYAVSRGTNLAVLGANELYWQTRVRRDHMGNVASMTVYRNDELDPDTTARDKTTEWRSFPLERDPAALTGLGMSGVGIVGDGLVVSTPSWLFRGTGLAVGTLLPRMYGNEGDGPADNNVPTNEQVLVRSDARTTDHRRVQVATGYYSAASGAGVFDAGTTEWLCSIVNMCVHAARTPQVRHGLDELTGNLLAAFARPKAGLTHPSRAAA